MKFLTLSILTFITTVVADSLNNKGTATWHDFEDEPYCEQFDYDKMDRNRLVAVNGISTKHCGSCLKVEAQTGNKPAQYVMVVDKNGDNTLDLAQGTFKKFASLNDGVFKAKWSLADKKYCNGINRG